MQPPLTQQEALVFASELNHLLWTEDTPEALASLADVPHDIPAGNMQCASHSVVCAALLARRGATITTRSGRVVAVEPSKREAFPILRHWWMTTENGLVDFSIRLFHFSEFRPIVFENSDLAGKFAVVSSFDFDGIWRRIDRARAAGGRGIFYHAQNKMSVTREEIEAELPKLFEASKDVAPITYGAIVRHCEQLLAGGQSLCGLIQREAWLSLSASK